MTNRQRRTQAERSEETRRKVAKAAYEVIAERGHSAFRTAAVIAHAGVSQGAMLHHYPTKDSLTLAAIDYALNLDREKSLNCAGKMRTDVQATLEAMVQDFRDFFTGDQFWVTLDITMDAAKDAAIAPAIRSVVAQARQPIYALWVQALVCRGWSEVRAQKAVIETAALISGFMIRSLWADDGRNAEASVARWIKFLMITEE